MFFGRPPSRGAKRVSKLAGGRGSRAWCRDHRPADAVRCRTAPRQERAQPAVGGSSRPRGDGRSRGCGAAGAERGCRSIVGRAAAQAPLACSTRSASSSIACCLRASVSARIRASRSSGRRRSLLPPRPSAQAAARASEAPCASTLARSERAGDLGLGGERRELRASASCASRRQPTSSGHG